MKIGIIINLYSDTLCLLKACLDNLSKINIEKYILVCYNNDNVYNANEFLDHFYNKKMIDNFLSKGGFELGYVYLLNDKTLTHYLCLEADEFYEPDDFNKILKKIEKKDYRQTYCCIQEYYSTPFYKISEFSPSLNSFVFSMNNPPHINKYINKKLLQEDFKFIYPNDLFMNKYGTIRHDLKLFFKNHYSDIDEKIIEKKIKEIKYYNNSYRDNLVKCDKVIHDKFNLEQSIGYFKAFYGI